MHRPIILALALLSCAAAQAGDFELLTGAVGEEPAREDPSVRILAGHLPMALDFALGAAVRGEPGAPDETAMAVQRSWRQGASWEDRPVAVRLWLQWLDAGPLRSTRAYVTLATTPSTTFSQREWHPGAGVVMNFGGSKGLLQQMSLGSMLRFDVAPGSQVALRFKGGRMGVQYRMQFTL